MSQKITDHNSTRRSKTYKLTLLGAFGLILLIAWLLNTPPGILGKADAIGYAVCHRISSHSFYLDQRPFSLCARCTGQYLGFLWGFLFQLFSGKSRAGFPRKGFLFLLALPVIIYLLDGTNSVLHLYPGLEQFSIYEPQNSIRLFTGLFFGLSLSVLIFPLSVQTVKRDYSLEPVLKDINQWLLLIGGVIIAGIITLLETSLILYPIILASTFGLFSLLTVFYTMIWLLILNKQNSIETWRMFVGWVLGGAITALVQIITIDVIRFYLTGSWSGFLDY
jgi:uncharacterized membrane protein